MVDAADSKSATCEGVGVQVPSPVLNWLMKQPVLVTDAWGCSTPGLPIMRRP